MPLYEYECQACHQVTEKIQKFSDAPLKTCPTCGGDLQKLMSKTSFSLKGSGWYVTDYKGAGKKSATTEKAPDTTPEKTAEKSTEAKPAASTAESKTESKPASTAASGGTTP